MMRNNASKRPKSRGGHKLPTWRATVLNHSELRGVVIVNVFFWGRRCSGHSYWSFWDLNEVTHPSTRALPHTFRARRLTDQSLFIPGHHR
ncbi:hypothetical protein RRG08_056406 [Elysia crispata]|uniref:Uncharacterized protein n=1 Tax=Elysia crispata TaxID=231223 RepID=A0AAE0Z0Q4_9GAST|nr:hypothetical protein RRG08_056406 [Elysia crispata]